MSEPLPSRPAEEASGLFRNDRTPVVALLVGCALAWIPTLGSRDLWAPDEPRYAEVAREMVERGDFLVPHLNDEVYPDKPPLFFWLEAGSASLLGGFSEFAVRLPSALSAIALVYLTYRMGLRLFGRRAAFFAGAILATTSLGFERATRAVIDPTLALFVAASLLVYLRARGEGNARSGAAFGALAGLGCLAKFPIGLLVPGLAVAADHFARRRRFPSLLPPLVAVLVGLAIPAAWFLLAKGRSEGGLSFQGASEQVFTRAFSPFNHEQPPWYYVLKFPVDFLPWTPFLLLGIPCLRRTEGKDRDGTRFCSLWLATTFLFFSALGSKRHIYLFPAFPAASLLTGLAVARACEGRTHARAWAKACEGTGFALLLFGFLLALASPFVAKKVPEVGVLPLGLLGLLLILGGAAVRRAFRHGGIPGAFLALPPILAAAGLFSFLAVLPRLDALKSPAPLAGQLRSLAPAETLLFLRVPPEGYRFYSGLPGRRAGGDAEFLAALASDPTALGVTTAEDYERLRPRLPAGTVPLARDAVGHRLVVVLGRPRMGGR